MASHWYPVLLSSPLTFLASLIPTSAHLDAILERTVESVEGSLLRQEVMHLISSRMEEPDTQADDQSIAALVQLIVGEIIGVEETSLKIHQSGLEKMIEARGGLHTLGGNGNLASLASWSGLALSILHGDKPRQLYLDYCVSRSHRNYPESTTSPESPLFQPHGRFEVLRRSPLYKEELVDLVEEVKAMVEAFLTPVGGLLSLVVLR
jgi:hypothetical protein